MRRAAGILALLGAATLAACTVPPDYGPFLDHPPRSILVLPPLNETSDVRASDTFLSTVSTALGECGYYVFPVAVVDRMMKENGLPTPGEMHQVPLEKVGEVFDADAVLYITIKEWSTRYVIFDTTTTVRLAYRLVDVRTGLELWQREQAFRDSSSAGAQDPFSLIIASLVSAIVAAASEPEWNLARRANAAQFNHAQQGLLKGPRHPDHERDRLRRLSERENRGKAGSTAAPPISGIAP